MNWKTTLALLLLVGGCVLLFWKGPEYLSSRSAPPGESETRKLLQEFAPKKLTGVEVVSQGKTLVKLAAAAPGQPLTLNGNWPIRPTELEQLTKLLTGLESRFVPIPFSLNDLPDSGIVVGGSPSFLASETLRGRYGFGENQKPVAVRVKIDEKSHNLTFGQPSAAEGENPFTQPTYLRVDDGKELIRLGPDVMAVLRRTENDYRLRRIFPEKSQLRVTDDVAPSLTGDKHPAAKSVDLLDDRVTRIRLDGPVGSYLLERVADLPKEMPLANDPGGARFVTPAQIAECWRLVEPVRDRIDPVKLKNILTTLADLWVDQFLEPTEGGRLGFPLVEAKKPLNNDVPQAVGLILSGPGVLAKGEIAPTLTLSFKDGTSRTLKLGKVTRTERKVEPPPQLPGAPPMPPRVVSEAWRVAQLGTNPLPFEVKEDKLTELFFNLDTGLGVPQVAVGDELRDSKLIYAPTRDVSRVSVQRPDRIPLVLQRTIKETDAGKKETTWDLQQPVKSLAETPAVEELLSALDSARASKDDIVPPEKATDLTALGLDPVSATKLVVEIDGKPKTLWLGKKEGGKVYARVEGWDRVNRIDDRLFNLVDRNDRVYRSLQLFDLTTVNRKEKNRVESIQVEKGKDTFTLQEVPGLVAKWNLTVAPARVNADPNKVTNLATELGSLRAVEYLPDPLTANESLRGGSVVGSIFFGQQSVKTDEFGLDEPSMKVTLTFAGPKKMAPTTLVIGKPRPQKPELYARLEGSPSVFAIPKATFDTLGAGSLALLPTEITASSPDELASVEIQRTGESPFTLRPVEKVLKLAEPIQAPVDPNLVQPLAGALTNLRVERYEAHKSDDLAKYGLQNPALRIRFTITESKPKAGIEPSKERILLIGNPTPSEKLPDNPFEKSPPPPKPPGRYAKLADEDAVFVIAETTSRSADLSMLELIERKLLNVLASTATRVELSSPEGELKLSRETNPWKVEGPTFPLETTTLDRLLSPFNNLRAEKFAAYGGQIDFAKYGLDPASKPVTVTVHLNTEKYKVELGKPVDEKQPNGSRYARVGDAQAVAILDGPTANDLRKSPLDFVERSLLKFDAAELNGITRVKGDQTLELKPGATGGWAIAKPIAKAADAPSLDDLIDRVRVLRAEKIVAYDGKDLGKYGLDRPEAVVTFDLIDQRRGKELKRALKLGKPVDEKKPDGDRYAQVEGSPLVAVVAAPIARELLGEPIRFLDRTLASFLKADRIELTRGERKLLFVKDPGWKLKSPVEADAEDQPLRDLHDVFARLRADEIVAEKPANLGEYGLDKPEFVWKLFDGDKEVLSLLVGKRVKDDFRRYAKLEKGDLIVLLDRGLSSRLDSEYRKRSLGERLDVTQITELLLSGPAGKATLNKLGPVWIDLAKGDEQLNPTLVNEMAVTLAGTRIEEYVKDKDANLSDFGLDPPQARTLTVRTAMGQLRTLLLGKLDASKRLYAKWDDQTRTEVFVLNEEDSKRLNRNRADLVMSDREVLPVPKEKKE